MANDSRSKGRTVLAIPKEGRKLRFVGLAIVGVLLALAVWGAISSWLGKEWFYLGFYLFGTACLGFIFGQIIYKMSRRVVLLEDHFAVLGMFGVPKIYSYDQITNLETVDDEWYKLPFDFDSFVRMTFADGSTLRVHSSLMSSREFRRLIRAKTGKIYRKPKRKHSWLRKKLS